MSLIRYHIPELSNWSRYDRLASFRNEVDRLFDFSRPTRDSGPLSGWTPSLDVFDDKDHYVVQVELPGVKKESIDLSLHDGVLTISGERKHEREAKDGGTFRSERTFGKFQRSVTLSTAVDSNKITANYKDGILTVELAKAEEAKPKQIAVTVS